MLAAATTDSRFGAGMWEGGIFATCKRLAACLLAVGELVQSASSHKLLAQTTEVQAKNPAGKSLESPLVPSIEKLLSDTRSPDRDTRLYTSAVALFKAIEAGTEPTQQRDLLAKALHEVAIGGHANAWIDYGRCLWNGWGVNEDREAAIAAYKRAADLGSDYGAYLVAYNLYWTFKRYDEAYSYAQKALKGDDPEGAVRYLLGLMAANGRGRPVNVPESLRLHLEAADRGNGDAYFELFVYAMQGMG